MHHQPPFDPRPCSRPVSLPTFSLLALPSSLLLPLSSFPFFCPASSVAAATTYHSPPPPPHTSQNTQPKTQPNTKTQVGDGTTSVVILAAELLKRANDLVRAKIHPTSIISGYRLAMREVRGSLSVCNWGKVEDSGVLSRCSNLLCDTILPFHKTSLAANCPHTLCHSSTLLPSHTCATSFSHNHTPTTGCQVC